MEDASELFVVGIASSAGGIEPLMELVSKAYCHRSMCFVIVSHVRRTHKTAIAQLLGKISKLKSQQATDGMIVEHCGIYTIPPKKYLTIEAGKLRLHPRPEHGSNQSANVFFESLAQSLRSNAIGVVLSGASVGADGAEGIRAIKRARGHTYAQDPRTAEFAGMPEGAIATGCVDSILSPEDIGAELSVISWSMAK